MLTSSRDNWERLVVAVVKRQKIWELCHQQSFSTINSDDFSELTLSSCCSNYEPYSVPPSPLFPSNNSPISQEFADKQLERFSLRQLQVATDGFNNKNILGRSGYWKVYKGRLVDGTLVSIKRHIKNQQTGHVESQFQTEIQIFGNVALHSNLLRLRGICTTYKELLLVYPYPVNGSVASCLKERPSYMPPLDWRTRKHIAIGCARGLSYLHEHCDKKIILRDVKAANIFLNEEYEAIVGDFSLAIFMDHNDNDVTTNVPGTIGYIAPEYHSTWKASEKSDVFAYGVMLLELITGLRAFDLVRVANDNNLQLLDWVCSLFYACSLNIGIYDILASCFQVKGLFKENKLEVLVDPDLHKKNLEEEVEQLIQVSLLCTQSSALGRPKMSEVLMLLKGDGLAEKWDGWQKVEELRQEVKLALHPSSAESPVVYQGQFERFSLHQLQVATDTFSNENFIGRGGYGMVYKGRLVDGTFVAVKRLKKDRTTIEDLPFQTEVKMFSIMAMHNNLLRLRGFCETSVEHFLVYPYMVNGSVASCLRERPPNAPPLDWWTRKRIALGCARGLSYLHDHCDPKIIHRDVKAANILLDEKYEAVVGDFSLAIPIYHHKTHETTDVLGTVGHVAPEYISTGEMSEKTDVFAYGVTLLELITALRAYDLARLAIGDNLSLLDWVKGLLKEKNLERLVDPALKNNCLEEEVEQLIQVALLCTQRSALGRPRMSEVVRLLEGDGLFEKWDEWQKVEELQEVALAPDLRLIPDGIVIDMVEDLDAVELSGPR